MKKKKILSAIIFVIIITGIAVLTLYIVLQQQKTVGDQYEPTDINNVIITLQRSECLGKCPVYNLAIYGNGTVIYEGIKNVNISGRQRSNISEKIVRQLLFAFGIIDYFSLNETKIASQIVYDAPMFTTSLTVNGKTKTIRHYETTQPTLSSLEDAIDELVHSSQWI